MSNQTDPMTHSGSLSLSPLSRQLSGDMVGDALQSRIRTLQQSIERSHSEGFKDKVVKTHKFIDSIWFKSTFVILTLMNTAQMGLEAEYPEWKTAWLICENVFLAGFLLEMISKLLFMKLAYFKDMANCLDGSLVFLGILDSWILTNLPNSDGSNLQVFSILRVLRLARLARILKLVRAFKPLVLVIRGLTATLSTLGYVFALLMLMIYVVAILLRRSLGEPDDPDLYPGYSTDQEVIDSQEVMMNYNPAVYFGSMWRSMITLFNMASFNEWQEVVRPVALRQPAYVLLFLGYALLVAFGVMNVMTGLIVDSVIAEAKNLEDVHAESIIKQRLQTLSKVEKILADIPGDTISLDDLSKAMRDNALLGELLRSIDLPSAWSADEFLYMLDNNGDGALQKSEFTTGFFRLLSSNSFQQRCIMQSSINSAKRQMMGINTDIQSKLSALQTDICSIKSALSTACPATDSITRSENGTGEPGRELCQPYNPNKLRGAAETTNNISTETPRLMNELEERIEQISCALLVEALDESYRGMRSSFQQELASLKSGLGTKFRENGSRHAKEQILPFGEPSFSMDAKRLAGADQVSSSTPPRNQMYLASLKPGLETNCNENGSLQFIRQIGDPSSSMEASKPLGFDTVSTSIPPHSQMQAKEAPSVFDKNIANGQSCEQAADNAQCRKSGETIRGANNSARALAL